MENETQPRVELLFHAALEHAPGPERRAYLDGACGQDLGLRSRVQALLDAHEEASQFLEGPAVARTVEGPGSSIGPYKLLQEIGEGGMGVVYMAEQVHPVSRMVALKVIKLGMDTKQVIARFEAERQALAMMDHPHIAKVLDAGATETGRPYFVMELVRGVSIQEYCDKQRLGTEARLHLFVEVCRAVQHAHQKGIIHRDLKPGNVLVTSHDGRPVPKIIDFGVAKATHQKLTERTLFTEFQQIIGTPEYMSPEQAEMSGLDVDTRSDIYALGVLLYQLLTGTTPVDPRELRTAGFEEMTRMIREDEPPAPSTRVSKLGAEADRIAEHRGSDVGSLSKLFRGDLDWVVMKALEKDRTRRYDSASAFAQDIERHLGNLPVEAGPRGTAYRLRKFARRNVKAVAAAAVLFGVVALGLAGTTAGFLRARDEAGRSQRINDALQDVLAMTDSTGGTASEETEALLGTVRQVFGEQHATYAAVLDTLSMRLHDAGDFQASAGLAEEAIEVWTRIHGERHPNVGVSLARLGTLQRLLGSEEEAEGTLRSALDILGEREVGANATAFDPLMELADLLGNRGDYEEANRLLGEALAILESGPSTSRFRIIETLERRLLLQLNASSSEALDTLRAIYAETREFYPETSPIIAIAALGLGNYLLQKGEVEEAEVFLREAVERFQARENRESNYSVAAHNALFQLLRGREDPEGLEEGDEVLRQTIELSRKFVGPEALSTNLEYYASRMLDRGRYGDAIAAVVDGHRALKEGGHSAAERESVRDNMIYLSFKAAVQPGLPAEDYEMGLQAAELALSEESTHPAMITVLGGILYRQGDFAAALETLGGLGRPLVNSNGGLARRIAPADHAFRSMAAARLGDRSLAEDEQAALVDALAKRNADGHGRMLLAEVEAAIKVIPSVDEDG